MLRLMLEAMSNTIISMRIGNAINGYECDRLRCIRLVAERNPAAEDVDVDVQSRAP